MDPNTPPFVIENVPPVSSSMPILPSCAFFAISPRLRSNCAKLIWSFFAKATVEALKKFPVVNASVEGTDVIYHNYFDIGIAVSTERGLMVPVLRDVDQMSFAQFERNLGEIAKKAQEGKIGMDELTGGTFSITNGGVFGSMMSTPILNQPQSAILGMHAIQQRPVLLEVMFCAVKKLGRFQHRFRWDTAGIQASAAKSVFAILVLPLIDARNF